MEADRKADSGKAGLALVSHPEERVTYRVGNKVTPQVLIPYKIIFLRIFIIRGLLA